MDLRTKCVWYYFPSDHDRSEHIKQAKMRQAGLKIPALIKPNDAFAEPAKISGIDYLKININGKGFERSLLRQLSG